MKVIISGGKYLGLEVFNLCTQLDITVVGVITPENDKYLKPAARAKGIKQITKEVPDFDLGINAHGFKMIEKELIGKARIGWIGYHPSLLPRHRGRNAIEWAIRMRDVITGGTIYWLNSGIDKGPIAYQDFTFINPELFAIDSKEAAGKLWRESLAPIGIKLFRRALNDLTKGVIKKEEQNLKFATYEPRL